jgi:hypothetical protein
MLKLDEIATFFRINCLIDNFKIILKYKAYNFNQIYLQIVGAVYPSSSALVEHSEGLKFEPR